MVQKKTSRTNGDRPTTSTNATRRKRAADALPTPEVSYRAIFNATNDGILLLDIESGEVVDANATFCNVLGYTPEEVRGLSVGDVSSGEAPYIQEDALRLIRKTAAGEPQHFEWLAKSRDGSLLWIDVTLKRATIAGRDCALAVGRDITERKRVEEALRESETKFRTLMETTAASVFIYRGTRPLYINAAMERLTGYTREEILAKELWQFVHPDFQSLVRERSRARQQGEQAPYRYEFKIVTKSGDERWLDFTASIIEFEGQPAAIGTFYDITERKRAEEALRESEERYTQLSDASFEGILLHDGTRVLDANQTLAEMYGCELAELIGMDGLEFVAPEWRDQVRQSITSGHEGPYDIMGLRGDGSTFPMEVCARTIPYRGQMVRVVAVRDITERKRAEEALRTSEATYRSIFNAANDGIVVHDMETGEIVDANAAFLDQHGCTADEARQLNVGAFSSGEPPYTQEDALRWVHKAARRDPQRFEWQAKDRDGRYIWLDMTLKRATIAGQDRVLAISRDITERKRAEEALQTERDRAQQYLDVAGVMFLAIDPDERVSLMNLKGCEVLGYEAAEIIGKNWFDTFLPARIREGVRDVFSQIVAGDIPPVEYFENPALTKSGEERTIAWHNALLKDEAGKICGTLSSGEDITERKQAEEALRETRDYLEKLIDYANAPIIVWDPNFTITRFNHAFERLTGRPAGEAVGQRLEVLFPEAERAASMEQIARTLRGEFWKLIEISILHQSGEVRRVLWNSANIAGPDGRTVVATIAQGTDITERKRAEEALRESEQRFRKVFEDGPLGMAIIDLDYRYVKANPTLCQMVGYTEQELGALTFVDITHPEHIETDVRHTREIFNREIPYYKVEKRYIKKNGEIIWVALTASVIRDDDGRPLYGLAMIEDITEHKQAEEALQKTREELEARVERQVERGNPYGLTFRELTVLHVVAAGKADKEIGTQLGITHLTASKHLTNILSKMGAASRTEACVRALREGLLD